MRALCVSIEINWILHSHDSSGMLNVKCQNKVMRQENGSCFVENGKTTYKLEMEESERSTGEREIDIWRGDGERERERG